MTAREAGFLLLCSKLGDPARCPLTTAQLRELTWRVRQMERPKADRKLTVEDLLDLGYDYETAERIVKLLSDFSAMEVYIRKGTKLGCRPITLISRDYPAALLTRLGEEAPGVLWAKGDGSLLKMPAIGLVGSRDLKLDNYRFAREIGFRCAREGFVLVSGNARGADHEAQSACLSAGGSVICIVADSLTDKQPDGQILYLSENNYDSTFSAERAHSRNRLIHSMGCRTFVAQTDCGKGGTWSGTVRNLRQGWTPVHCFCDGSEGAEKLVQMGAESVDFDVLAKDGRLFSL